MNNDLEQFSEERLKDLMNVSMDINVRFSDADIIALARIVLAVKQAKPVAWTSQSNLDAVALEISNNLEFMSGDKGVYKNPVPLYTTPPANSPAIQDGWKLVPIEPTYEMKLQVHPIAVGTCHNCGCEVNPDCEDNVLLSWQDMLAAAPKPESE